MVKETFLSRSGKLARVFVSSPIAAMKTERGLFEPGFKVFSLFISYKVNILFCNDNFRLLMPPTNCNSLKIDLFSLLVKQVHGKGSGNRQASMVALFENSPFVCLVSFLSENKER